MGQQSVRPPDILDKPPDILDDDGFDNWYKEVSKKYDLSPDPEGQFYDYRAAYKAGAKPNESGHWPSKFKLPGHPNEIVGGFNTRTGKPEPGYKLETDPAKLKALGWEDLPEIAKQEKPEEGTLGKLWRLANVSAFPDIKNPVNYDEKNPKKIMKSEEPDTYAEGFDRSAGETLYNEIIKPAGSALGVTLAVAGGPMLRGAGRVASKIPYVGGAIEGIGNFLAKERHLFGSAKKETQAVASKIIAPKPPDIPDAVVPDKLPVITKLHKALEESGPLNEKQLEINTAERAKKFASARDVDITDSGSANKFMSNLAGKHARVTMEPLKLDQPDVDTLHGMIGEALKADVIDTPEAAQSITALRSLLEGGVPNKSQIEVLEKVFGEGIAERIPSQQTGRQLITKAISIPKSIVSSLDLGFPFRQGINMVGRKEWFGMLRPAIEAYASEGGKEKWMEAIKSEPLFDLAKRSGLPIGDVIGAGREEHAVINMLGGKEIPYGGIFGKAVNKVADTVARTPGIINSNRAYTIGAAKLRMDLFKTQYADYRRLYQTSKSLAGNNKELIKAAELFNPDNLYRSRQIADSIAIATGRGRLGKLEPIAEELNATLFAPRLMSARFQTIKKLLNPMTYSSTDPVMRKDAIKQLISITGTALSSAAMFKAAGGEVELDPRSTDFLKGKIGKVRFDLGGGYLQYIVPTAKLIGYSTGHPGTKQTGTDVIERFFTNKASPLASVFISFMRGRDATGKKVNFSSPSPFENTAMESIVPFMIQDFKDLAEEDPTLLPALIPGAMMGGGIEVHKDKIPSKEMQRRRR